MLIDNSYTQIEIGKINTKINYKSIISLMPLEITMKMKITKIPIQNNQSNILFLYENNKHSILGIYKDKNPTPKYQMPNNACQGLKFEFISAQYYKNDKKYDVDHSGIDKNILIDSDFLKNGAKFEFKTTQQDVKIYVHSQTQSFAYSLDNTTKYQECPYMYYGGFFNGHINSSEQLYCRGEAVNGIIPISTLTQLRQISTINNQPLFNLISIDPHKHNMTNVIMNGGIEINITSNECTNQNVKKISMKYKSFKVEESAIEYMYVTLKKDKVSQII